MEQALEISNIKCANHMHLQWVQTCTVLSYLFIRGYDLYRQLFTTKSSIVCVHDNVLKRVFATFQGKGKGIGGSGVCQWHVPLSRICHCKHRVKKKKRKNTTQIHSNIYKRLKFISFQCALGISVISFFFFFSRKLGKIQVCIDTRWTLIFTYTSVINPEYTAIILFCRLKFSCLRGKTVWGAFDTWMIVKQINWSRLGE